MEGPEQELIDQAGALLDRLGAFVATQRELCAARDLVRVGVYRAVGPHRNAANARRLAAACEQARALLESRQLKGAYS